ncbi:RNA polymerase, sigma-24 subunit, ECF subfamily [Syntrophobotulus glycolicus DSM 8271]|uniref:RNA polymerase, sigma-24 subunit, ECF subfamily n=1 Tax=Syntrophobotulus glycolicus (strain DSM 8271 / FlGlyR) TaxID=645991 RepID=F0T1X3_SYNGF|nr:sigma-70 family RNA polymerase sigma factor [Syntrophobotulus glycolicus]ADY55237.1 RNA polymerase, sigma-24 subunit, ECF subfamily [Syntrophobotulus glycolicus DSM 8271]
MSQLMISNFAHKYNLYGNMVFRIAMVNLGNKEDAEEAMQEAFYKLLYKSPQFKDEEHEKAWLIKVTVNLCRDIQRSFWRKKVVQMEEIETDNSDPYDSNILKDIVQLPAKYKTVIYFYYFEDYSIKQIAEVLNIKESAIKMRLQRGRQLLKIKLEGNENG